MTNSRSTILLLLSLAQLALCFYRFTPRDHKYPDILLRDVTWDSLDEKKYFYWHLAGINSSEMAFHDALPRGPRMPPYHTAPPTKRYWRKTPKFERWGLPWLYHKRSQNIPPNGVCLNCTTKRYQNMTIGVNLRFNLTVNIITIATVNTWKCVSFLTV